MRMRGLWKAAALLSSLSASASSVPRSLPSEYQEALDFVTKYSEYQELFRRRQRMEAHIRIQMRAKHL